MKRSKSTFLIVHKLPRYRGQRQTHEEKFVFRKRKS